MIKYTYDGWDVIREDSSVKGVTTYQNGLGIDNKLRSKNGTTVRYFLTDHLGSTVALADASGAIVSSTSYDSFGNSTSDISTSYRYTGREYDSETGLYYYRNRWYDPEIGRFTSKDPIGFAGGDINLYGYVGNSPLNFTDPSGNSACGPQKQKRQKRRRKRQRTPCPPESHDVTFFSTKQQLNAYDKVLELSEKNRREEGGWVYQNQRTGKLWSRLKDRDAQQDEGDRVLSINLGTPPKLKGWKVVGTFHTHPNDLGPSGEIEFLPNGMISASGDHLANWSQGVPGLVVTRLVFSSTL